MPTPLDAEKDSDLQLLKLSRHYASLSPSTPSLIPSPPFPSSETLSRPATQSWLAEHLLASPNSSQDVPGGEALVEESDGIGAGAWKKVFWRRVVKGIEEGFELRKERGESVEDEEVHESILEAMVSFLSAAPVDGTPGVDLRTYYWGPISARDQWNCVKMKEEHRMISGGTTGLRTWQACIALSNHVLADSSFLTESASPIIELGAGAGLLSLLAARISNRMVVSTDVDPSVLAQLEGNIRSNGLHNVVVAKELDWELSVSPEGREELLDWETTAFGAGERAQLILGADIVYDPVLTSQLASTLAFLLRPSQSGNSNPRAFIAGTIRNESTWTGFLDRCRDRGLRVEEVELLGMGEDGIVGAEGSEGEGEMTICSPPLLTQPQLPLMPLPTTTHLPLARKVLLVLGAVCGGLDVVACATTLGYQLSYTSSYQRAISGLLPAGFLAAVFPSFFLLFGSLGSSKVGLFLRSIAFELIAYAGIGALTLSLVADLHRDTPGLINHCGSYAICYLLKAVVALSWLVVLLIGLAFALLLLSTIYLKVLRQQPISLLTTPFTGIKWDAYASHGRRSVHGLREVGTADESPEVEVVIGAKEVVDEKTSSGEEKRESKVVM